jgi:hypothetical protein
MKKEKMVIVRIYESLRKKLKAEALEKDITLQEILEEKLNKK